MAEGDLGISVAEGVGTNEKMGGGKPQPDVPVNAIALLMVEPSGKPVIVIKKWLDENGRPVYLRHGVKFSFTLTGMLG